MCDATQMREMHMCNGHVHCDLFVMIYIYSIIRHPARLIAFQFLKWAHLLSYKTRFSFIQFLWTCEWSIAARWTRIETTRASLSRSYRHVIVRAWLGVSTHARQSS
jgi:hypothetical protein